VEPTSNAGALELRKRGFQLAGPAKTILRWCSCYARAKRWRPRAPACLAPGFGSIEARSCERFKLLWQHIADRKLKANGYELMVLQAAHLWPTDLAKEYRNSNW
jgi:tRNA-(ms[2]io[6]A)-hydroxylase